MSKTITIIQLLNKIANGEEPPEKIRIAGHRYKYNKETKDYDSDIGFDNKDLFLHIGILEELNTPIIIEEQEEIDIQELEEIKEMEVFVSVDTRQTLEENLKKIDKHEVNFFLKINEIIRKQNKIVQYLEQLDKNIKEK